LAYLERELTTNHCRLVEHHTLFRRCQRRRRVVGGFFVGLAGCEVLRDGEGVGELGGLRGVMVLAGVEVGRGRLDGLVLVGQMVDQNRSDRAWEYLKVEIRDFS
jgi:hypothetical protein